MKIYWKGLVFKDWHIVAIIAALILIGAILNFLGIHPPGK